MENKDKTEIENLNTKKRFNFKIDFSNALVVLIGVAILSVIIYAFILRLTSDGVDTVQNQLNNQNTNTRQEILSTGSGYIVYKIGNQYYLQVTDGSKVKDVNALRISLDLPEDTQLINPAAVYPRPISPDVSVQEGTQHLDGDFGVTNPQTEEPQSNVAE
jgi:hypothetical protein